MERIGIAHLAATQVGTLAHGQRQLVELATVIAPRPALILLDEPAAGLTEAEQAELAGTLRAAADAGAAVLIVEHNMPFLLPLADRITCLDEGRVIAEGTPDAIRRDRRVRAAYLGSPGPEVP